MNRCNNFLRCRSLGSIRVSLLAAVAQLLLMPHVARAQVYSYSEFGVIDDSDNDNAYLYIWSTGSTESADPDACVDTYLDDPDSNNLEWAEECSNDYVAVAYTPEVVLYHNDSGHSAEGTYHAFSWSFGAGSNGCSGPVDQEIVAFVAIYRLDHDFGDNTARFIRCTTGPCLYLTLKRTTYLYPWPPDFAIVNGLKAGSICAGWSNLGTSGC
jgi:hypothetical protein